MRAETSAPGRRGASSRVLSVALLAAALAGGCRTAAPGGRVDADQTWKAVAGAGEARELAALPEAPGKTLVTERCLLCHSAALIAQQRKDAAAWARTVTQMRAWGTPIEDQDQAALVAYLAEHFGQGAPPRREEPAHP